MKKKIGNIIRYHRKEARISQKELANLAEIGKTAVFEIEKGESNYRIETLLHILDVLNIKMQFESPLMEIWKEKHETNSSESKQ
jgi:HTH-type transcriptional regulator / antitoxin HipB